MSITSAVNAPTVPEALAHVKSLSTLSGSSKALTGVVKKKAAARTSDALQFKSSIEFYGRMLMAFFQPSLDKQLSWGLSAAAQRTILALEHER